MNLRPVLFVLGIILCTTAIGMIAPMVVDMYANQPDWQVFATCIAFTGFFGSALVLINMGGGEAFGVKQAFLLTTMAWVAMAIFGALPFMFCDLRLSFVDALFESMSGVTTTGSTVIVGLDNSPPGILLWRALLQWFGGIGIILMAMSVLPFLNIGGMQIFKSELSENEKALPRTTQMASYIAFIYLGLTCMCALAYSLSGMGSFDAVAHALTTISTGGFSTFDSSFAGHATPWTEVAAIVFMIAGSVPFVLYLKAAYGDAGSFLRDSQVRGFAWVLLVSIALIGFYLIANQGLTFWEAVLSAAFNVVSLVTGTGFVDDNYGLWGEFAISFLFFLMFIGGCAGSTTCGIKIFRFQVLWAVASVQIKKLLHPNAVFVAHYNKKPIPDDVPMSVMSFFFLFVSSFVAMALALSFSGLDFLTSVSGAASAIANVGPGFGSIIGPTGTFKPLPDLSKLILTFGMLMGRLEIFTVLVLFVPRFWKK